MAIIIGAGTIVDQVSFIGTSGAGCRGASQASWDYSTNTTRLYQLGSWEACDTYGTPQQTLNLTFYSLSTKSESITAVTTCVNETVQARVLPADCDNSVDTLTGPWYITGYSYSKGDARQPGTESWSLMKYTGTPGQDAPTWNLRGIAEGTINSDYNPGQFAAAETMTGVDMVGTPSDTVSVGSSGSVSAGQIGNAEYVYADVVTAVGGSTSPAGKTASASVSIPYTALWV